MKCCLRTGFARNLREGRFLLIILGDGIREDMAVLANYLMHHSLRYAFGMIQIKLYRLPDGSLVALPEVLVKTQTVERHVTVVTIAGEGTVHGKPGVAVVGEKVEKTSISLDEFYRTMAQVDPRDVVWLKDLLSKLADLPIETELGAKGASLMLKASLPCGERIQFMIITATPGATHVGFWGIPYKAWSNPAWQRLSRAYLEKIVAIVPGASIKIFKANLEVKIDGLPVPASAFQGKVDTLADAIRQVARDAQSFYDTKDAE